MKGMKRVALVLVMVAIGASSIEAAEVGNPDDEVTTEVRVVNNYTAAVRVYAEDAGGRLHPLGRVAHGQFKAFRVPPEVLEQAFRIKIYPNAPVWSLQNEAFGIKSNALNLYGTDEITFWVETDLTQSVVQIERG